MNQIYSTLHNNLNGAEQVGPCVWGIPVSIQVFNTTEVRDYFTVATTHDLGFNHDRLPTFIAQPNAYDLPVWDSFTLRRVDGRASAATPPIRRL